VPTQSWPAGISLIPCAEGNRCQAIGRIPEWLLTRFSTALRLPLRKECGNEGMPNRLAQIEYQHALRPGLDCHAESVSLD
jgi:hypothetical protein